MDHGGWGERRLIGGPTDWSGKDRAEDACLHVSLWRREAASLHSIENIRASATYSVPLFPFMTKGEGQRAEGGIFASSLVFLFFSFSWCQCNHTACRRLTICPGRKRAARIPGAAGSQHGVQSALVHGLSHVVAGLVGTDGAHRGRDCGGDGRLAEA